MKTSSVIPAIYEAEVVVVGAGSAGCCAAIAAAEAGRSVVLIERYGFAGGTSTQILDTFYGFFTPGDQPRKVVGGIPDRVVDALDFTGDVFLRPNTYGAGTGVTYNPERLKLVWDTLLLGAGVKMLLHAWLCDVETASDGRIIGVIVHTREAFCAWAVSDSLTPAATQTFAISPVFRMKRRATLTQRRHSRPRSGCVTWTSTASRLRVERRC
jgi:FAD dependent oxidoreductase